MLWLRVVGGLLTAFFLPVLFWIVWFLAGLAWAYYVGIVGAGCLVIWLGGRGTPVSQRVLTMFLAALAALLVMLWDLFLFHDLQAQLLPLFLAAVMTGFAVFQMAKG